MFFKKVERIKGTGSTKCSREEGIVAILNKVVEAVSVAMYL